MKKEILVMAFGDLHTGHRCAVTPPYGWYKHSDDPVRNEYLRWQKALWNFWKKATAIKTDYAFCMGDLIEGPGQRNSGKEILCPVSEQIKMATCVLKEIRTDRLVMVYGTPYHVGVDRDNEDDIANNLKYEKGIGKVEIDMIQKKVIAAPNGNVNICARHYTSSGSMFTRGTGTLKEAHQELLDDARNELDGQIADLNLRGHTHHEFTREGIKKRSIIHGVPCLKGFLDDYGQRQCNGLPDIGITLFHIRGPKDIDVEHIDMDVEPYAKTYTE